MGNACMKKFHSKPRVYSVSNGELASAVIGSTDISTLRSTTKNEKNIPQIEDQIPVIKSQVPSDEEDVELNTNLDLPDVSISEELEDKMPVPDLQKPAPQFSGIAVVDGQFKNISLEDYKGKYVVLFFYPLDFTFVCPTEIIAFSERAEEFRQIGCELIACSTDSHFCHLAWVNTPRKQGGLGSMNIPLLADKSGAISKAYGVYKDDEGLTFRGLFIIDGNQNLRQVTINDLPVGRSVDETLRLVQAFQFTDKHGEVCPAGWTPGKKSMKADPTGSKEYFESQH